MASDLKSMSCVCRGCEKVFITMNPSSFYACFSVCNTCLPWYGKWGVQIEDRGAAALNDVGHFEFENVDDAYNLFVFASELYANVLITFEDDFNFVYQFGSDGSSS